MSSTIQIRVDDDLKQKSDVLFRELGTDTTSAVRIFLTQAVAHNGFPFEIRKTSANPFAAMSEAKNRHSQAQKLGFYITLYGFYTAST